MNQYHKIQTVFKRDPETKYKTLLLGEFSTEEFRYLQDNQWFFTEKVDGTNIRVDLEPNSALPKIRVRGKTDNAQLHPHLIENITKLFEGQEEKLSLHFPAGFCLYGEGYGPGIQKGGDRYRIDKGFVLFDVKGGEGNNWFKREAVEEIARDYNLDIVPIVGMGTLQEMIETVQAKPSLRSHWGDFEAEGIVARPVVELLDRFGQRVITKIKSKDFEDAR